MHDDKKAMVEEYHGGVVMHVQLHLATAECCCHQQYTNPESCVEAMDGRTPKQVQQTLHELCKHRNDAYALDST